MDEHIESYFEEFSDDGSRGNFHKVIALHDSPDVDWKIISQKIPQLPKGWYELAQLPVQDRIEFSRDFWISKLPFHLNAEEFIEDFFGSMDDVGIFIVQKTFEDPFEAQMVYSIEGNNGFYRGGTPATEEDIFFLQTLFSEMVLPEDYLAFLQIHNGFCKTTDCTGITSTHSIPETFQNFQFLLEQNEPLKTTQDEPLDPKTLIPFYESFGMPFFQCFWSEWYPAQEMGNVYYSGETNSISDTRTRVASPENMAFPTFLDWLMFYLERVE